MEKPDIATFVRYMHYKPLTVTLYYNTDLIPVMMIVVASFNSRYL